jgi:hypothetical protein
MTEYLQDCALMRGRRLSVVTMVSPSSISRRQAEEFFEAIREYVRWALSCPEQPLTFARYVQLSLVCGRVASFTDPLPAEVFDALYLLAIDDSCRHLKKELRANPTYATAARCFLEMIEAKKQLI